MYDPKTEQLVKKVLSKSEHFPDEFKSWIGAQINGASFSMSQLPREVGIYVAPISQGSPGPAPNRIWVATGVDSNPGACWSFRYNAQSTSSYKWEFIGGTPRYNHSAGLTLQANDTDWHDMVGTTPPLEGDYIVSFGAGTVGNDGSIAFAGTNDFFLRAEQGGTGGVEPFVTATAAYGGAGLSFTERRLALAKTSLLTVQGRSGLAGNAIRVHDPWLTLTPIRVL